MISQFLNLEEKKFHDNIEIIFDEIIKVYNICNKTHKINEKNMIIPKFGYYETMQALHKLYFYE